MDSVAVEIAVQDLLGTQIARDLGATSVEVAPALALGGLTPSAALTLSCIQGSEQTASNILIRPRQGGFHYQDSDKSLILAEIEWLRSTVSTNPGAKVGIVVGALTESGAVDIEFMSAVVGAAGTLPVTFHRAIDQTASLLDAAVELAELGVERILSSGGAPTASQGIQTLTEMQRAVPGVEIVAGGGLSVADIPRVLEAGIRSIHLSAKSWVPGSATGVSLGAHDSNGDNGYFSTSTELIVRALQAIEPFAVRH